jgi:His/Glu/Gln/Arg/opine family amino acid ABC transporter permease subunit
MTFDWAAVIAALPDLLQGLRLTLLIALAGLAGGIVLGILAGVALTYGGRLTVLPAQLYVALIRGTPIVVQVMFVYFALPIMMDIRISGISAAIITLVVNSGAYNAEIIRGALDGVPFGLREAGLAMGLPFSYCAASRHHTHRLSARAAGNGKPVRQPGQGHLDFSRHRRRRTDPPGPGNHGRELSGGGDLDCGGDHLPASDQPARAESASA